MQLGIISLSDVQAGQGARARVDDALHYAGLADRLGLDVDFAQLDLVSGGRAEITVGRSAFAEPFALFGHRLEDYDALFAEKLELLLALRERETISWSGRFRPPLIDAEIAPRALQDPLPVWIGVGGTPQSAARAGHLGLPMTLGLIGGSLESAPHAVESYRAAQAVRQDRAVTAAHPAAREGDRCAGEPAPARGHPVPCVRGRPDQHRQLAAA